MLCCLMLLCTHFRPMDLCDYDDKCQDQLICFKEDIVAKNNYNEINLGQY